MTERKLIEEAEKFLDRERGDIEKACAMADKGPLVKLFADFAQQTLTPERLRNMTHSQFEEEYLGYDTRELCDCELRNRQWDGYGKCLTCKRPYRQPDTPPTTAEAAQPNVSGDISGDKTL